MRHLAANRHPQSRFAAVIFIGLLLAGTETGKGVWKSPPRAPADLHQAVAAFWDALQQGSKTTAMSWVHPEDLNQFLHWPAPSFTKWRLINTESVSQAEALVTVEFTRVFPGIGPLTVQVSETWWLTEQGWRVRIESLSELYRQAFRTSRSSSRNLPNRLEVFPPVLKFYRIAPKQPGVILIRNGLEKAVHFVGLDLDSSLLRLDRAVEEVPPRSTSRIRLDYVGKLDEENVAAEITLYLREEGGQDRAFVIPVLYNYSDRGTRWVSRRVGQDTRKAKEGEPVQAPARPESPPAEKPPGGNWRSPMGIGLP